IEVRKLDLIRHAAGQCEGWRSIFRRVEWFGGTEITRFRGIVVGFGVRDAAADAQYSLRSNLICDTQPRTKRPRIVFRECAVAFSFAVTLENDSSGKSAGG